MSGMKISTKDFIKDLDIDQLRYCRDMCEQKIERLEAEPRRVVWVVVVDNYLVDSRFKTEDYGKAWERLLSLKGRFTRDAEVFVARDDIKSTHYFNKDIPRIEAELVSVSEYEGLDFDERVFG